MDNTEQSIISFCSGYSGIELGLGLAGLKHRVVAYVEIEAFAVANMVSKMESGHLVPAPVWTNLKTFPVDKFRGRVHGITAGYPCQPFSAAGQRKGADDPRHLWPYIRRAVGIIQPRWCFFENVEGHISLGLSTVISDLEEDGYRTTWGIFSASEVGAPHQRKRVFILASARGQESNRLSDRQERKENLQIGQSGVANSKWIGRRGWNQDGPEVLGCGTTKDQAKGSGALADTEGSAQSGRNIRQGQRKPWGDSWPSRPGEQQYDWEKPRTMAVTKKRKDKQSDEQSQVPEGNLPPTVKPGMGSSVDGTSTRVDQLRLLGNGVVPQTAAKAWVTLNKQMRGE